eukprot:10624033-Ditylum_brightwellii.AAC.1
MGIGEALQRLAGKAFLFVCGAEATAAWIEGEIYAMNDMWMDYGHEEGWGVLLVDARNVFN